MFNPKPFKLSRTHFPLSHILTNTESAIVCCVFSARYLVLPPGHLKVVESGHFLCVSGRSVLWQLAKLFNLVKRSLLGTLKTCGPAQSPLAVRLRLSHRSHGARRKSPKSLKHLSDYFQISKLLFRPDTPEATQLSTASNFKLHHKIDT